MYSRTSTSVCTVGPHQSLMVRPLLAHICNNVTSVFYQFCREEVVQGGGVAGVGVAQLVPMS